MPSVVSLKANSDTEKRNRT